MNTADISQKIADKLVRILRNKNYGVSPVNTSGKENAWDIEKIWVTKQGRDLCDINCDTGTISYRNSYDRDEINEILELIQNIREQEDVYTKAPSLGMEGLNRYRLLSQYNNVVFAACEISVLDHSNHRVNQYDYVTWEMDRGSHGVHAGNYFGDKYDAAKEDFAQRSGLINEDKLFSETEMLTIYAGLVKIQSLGEINSEQEKVVDKIKGRINKILPEVESQIYHTNPKFEESKRFMDSNENEPAEDDEQEI